MCTACNESIRRFHEKFNTIEKETQAIAYRLWRDEMARELGALDREATAMIRQHKPACRSKGTVKCRILSSAGYIEFRIHRLYDPKTKETIYPFQYVLGKRHRVTTELREKAMVLAVHVPYGRTSKLLEKLVGVKMGKMRIWEGVQRSGTAIRKQIEQRRKKIFKQGDDRMPQTIEPAGLPDKQVIVEADGTFIHVRNEVRQDLLTEEVSEEQLVQSRRAEVKVGVMFRGVLRRSPTRKETIAPTVWAEIARVKSFGERWYAKCRSDGYNPSDKTTFISDGSGGLRQLHSDHFSNAVSVLDLYHVERSLGNVLHPSAVSAIVHQLCRGHSEAAIMQLENTVQESPPLVRKAIRHVVRYLKDNRDGLHYHRTVIRGSGVVEKLVDNLVKRRFKRQGMSWSVDGANNLLALRSAYFDYESRAKFRRFQAPMLTAA